MKNDSVQGLELLQKTRSLNTIKNNTIILNSFFFEGQYFDVRRLSFRKNAPLFIVTFRNINDSMINLTKVTPIAELTYTGGKRLRFTCRPSVNYPELKGLESIIISTIEESI